MKKIIIIAHNLRSSHNVGSLLRTADALGVQKVYLTGHTPYPASINDERMPHIAQKTHKAIAKTALGAENQDIWERHESIETTLSELRNKGYKIVALEQTDKSIELPNYNCPEQIALIVGREVEGIEDEIIAVSDEAIEIPMLGTKESLNVVQAAAIAVYHCRFMG